HASHFWIWSGDRAPAVRADIVSLGSERWLTGGWLASATVFARRATGLTVPDPKPGPLGSRATFVLARDLARGAEIGVRRMGARWSTSVGYAFAVSERVAAGHRYPSPADRRHLLDATLAVRVAQGLRLAAAFSAMSGAPFTRAY